MCDIQKPVSLHSQMSCRIKASSCSYIQNNRNARSTIFVMTLTLEKQVDLVQQTS